MGNFMPKLNAAGTAYEDYSWVGRADPLQALVSGGGNLGYSLTDFVGGSLAMISAGAGESATIETIDGVNYMKGVLSTTPSAVYTAEYTFAEDRFIGKFDSIDIPIKFNKQGVNGVGSSLIQVWLYTTGTSTNIRPQISTDNLKPGVVNVVSISRDTLLGGATLITQAEVDSISKIRVLVTAGSAVSADSSDRSFWVGPMRVNDRRVGRVAIFLDGQYDSQHKYILPLLDRYGLKASLALAKYSLIGTAGFMTEAQIIGHERDGHDLVHHTFGNATTGYANAADWPTAASITADVNASWDWMRARGAVRGIGHAVVGYVSYWNGTTGAVAGRDDIISQGFAAAGVVTLRRGGSFSAASGGVGMLHPLGSRKTWLPWVGCIQVTSTTTPADVQARVDAAEQRGQLAGILFHRSVLDAAVPGSLEMKNSDIATCLEYIAGRVRLGGLKQDTMANIYRDCAA